jgi:hypothetical protein
VRFRWHCLPALALLFAFGSVVHAQNTLNAWGNVRLETPSGRIPFGVPTNLSITLATTRDNSYRQTINSGSRTNMRLWLSSGEFQFLQVPAGVPVQLTVTHRFTDGSERSLRSTFRLSYPTTAQRALTGARSAERVAGYLGEVILHEGFSTRIYLDSLPAWRIR